jgi:hypothetical protein
MNEKRTFSTGSVRDDDSNKPLTLFSPYLKMRVGYLLRKGAKHYGKDNYKKGQPIDSSAESLDRHWTKWTYNWERGIEQDEDHLAAIVFGVILLMQEEEKKGIGPDHFWNKIKR